MAICQKCDENFTLSKCKVLVPYKILTILDILPLKYSRRLAEVGFLPNQQVEILKKSMQGKNFLISIRGFVISIRKEIADAIKVEAI